MKSLVVDSSVAIKWFIEENHQSEAMAISQEWIEGQIQCVVPDWFFVEVGNILWKKLRQQAVDEYEVSRTLAELDTLPFRVVESRALTRKAVAVAIQHDRTVYDSLYIVLAIEECCSFVTADDRLANAVAAHIPNVIKLSDWKPASSSASTTTQDLPTQDPPTSTHSNS